MTATPYNYVPPSVSGYFPNDLYNYGAPASGKIGEAKFHPSYKTKVIKRTPEGDVVHWQVLIEDMRGGLNCTFGKFSSELIYESGDYDRIAWTDAEARFYRTLCLPQLTTQQTLTQAIQAFSGVHSANAFNKLHIAMGNNTYSPVVFAESTAPTLTGTSIPSPAGGGFISCLRTVAIGGASPAERLMLGSASAAAILYDSNYVGTSMHGDTIQCYGAIQTFINNNTLLIMSNGALRSLDSTVAVNTQPTVTLANVPIGGWAMGLAKLAGAPIRPYWVFPTNPGGAIIMADTGFYGRVVSTNPEGNDYQEVPTGLRWVQMACIANDSAIVASDGQRVTINDGRSTPRDILCLTDRLYAGTNTANFSDYTVKIRGVGARGPEVWVELVATNNVTTYRWWERYDMVHNAWHQMSKAYTLSGTDSTVLMAGSMPWSTASGYIYTYSGTASGSTGHQVSAIQALPYGTNPYTAYNSLTGTVATYDNNINLTSPKWELPGLEGHPKMATRLEFLGDLDAGGAGSQCTVTAGNLTGTYITGLSQRAQLADFVDTGDVFYPLQITLTGQRGSGNTHVTPNFLPILVEGYCFVRNVELPYAFIDDQNR